MPETVRKACWAALSVFLLLGGFEAIARLTQGAPPPSGRVARSRALAIVEHQGGWGARRGVDGELRPLAPSDGRPRVGVMGGSSVMQDPLGGEHNFPVWLGRALPGVQILNLGTPGASSSSLATLAPQLGVLDLDAVVVYTGHNDFGNLLMGGEMDTSARWQVRAQQLLAESWLHALLRRTLLRHEHSAPHLQVGEDRLVFTSSDQAQREQIQTTDRLIKNLRVLARDLELPVLWVPPIANLMHAPQGLRSAEPSCQALAQEQPRARPHRSGRRARELAQVCGEDTALGHWLLGHEALDRGDQEAALRHFELSLALDPTPLRMPLSARRAQFDLAEELGQPAVDLWAQDPIWANTDFLDTLHFSRAGAERVAEHIAPALEAMLHPPK